MRLGLVAFAVLALGLFAACGSDNSDLERRIAALEAQPQIGDMIVVGNEIKTNGAVTQFCIRYRAFGSVEETCIPISQTASTCAGEARVGEPLPDSCR